MARITVEDCLENLDNRFQLVLVSTQRARQLANGRDATLEWENDKPTVMALREIAAGNIGPEVLDEPILPESELMAEEEEAAAGEEGEGEEPTAEAAPSPEAEAEAGEAPEAEAGESPEAEGEATPPEEDEA